AEMLVVDESQQTLHLGGVMSVRCKDFRSVLGRHVGAIEEPMSFMQTGDGLRTQTVALQADQVKAANLGGIAVDHHESRHVMVDAQKAADVAVGSHGHKRMNGDPA